jgi:ribosomal-protein-alanine N-acetyltransferase
MFDLQMLRLKGKNRSASLNLKIERMQEKHIATVVALEQACRLNSRGEAGYQKALQDARSVLLVMTPQLSWRLSSEIIAIFSAQIIVDELQIDNLAVAESHRRKGVATILLAKALEMAKEKGMNSAVLEVRANNFAAINLYEQHGFVIVGRRRNYYQNPSEDALTMTLTLCKRG